MRVRIPQPQQQKKREYQRDCLAHHPQGSTNLLQDVTLMVWEREKNEEGGEVGNKQKMIKY
jgi:hypothetical protein